MSKILTHSAWRTTSSVALVVMLATSCSSDDETAADSNEPSTDTPVSDITPANQTPLSNVPSVAFSCEEIATKFVTRGSANDDLGLPEPETSAACVSDNVIVTSNQIPDFPYIETSPGNPRAFDLEYTIPATPVFADDVIPIPALGSLGIAINGIPIYGATEGTGGDVLSMPNFIECGGHNGPGGYHYHTFSVVGTDYCLFTEDDLNNGPVLFGYAFDGYPIYSGNNLYRSSWFLSDPALFATDTFSAHTYAEGSGDLDQCNGRTDDNGNYAYYTTDGFPYTLGCYRGVVSTQAQQRPNGPGGTQ